MVMVLQVPVVVSEGLNHSALHRMPTEQPTLTPKRHQRALTEVLSVS